MSENQAEIDALLEEVNALASQAVGEISDSGSIPSGFSAPATTNPSAFSEPQSLTQAQSRSSAGAGHGNMVRVLHLEVPVIVRLAERSMPMSDILNLTSGSIIEFEKSSDAELDLLINNKCVAHGLAVKVGENFGLRISTVGSVQDRIKALGT